MLRTHLKFRTLIPNSSFKQRCQPFQNLHAIQRPHRQLSSKPPPDNLSNLSPLDNLHAARDEFARRRRLILIPTASIAIFLSLAGAIYLYNQSASCEGKIFDPPRFTPFTITAREDISPTAFILTILPQTTARDDDPYKQEWVSGVWSVEIKQPLLQIARNYTPLPPPTSSPPNDESNENNGSNSGELRFLIRKERGGEVSNYLSSLPVGAKLELRGPHRGLDLARTPVKEVLFLAGGTGIAPALQIVHTLLGCRGDAGERAQVSIIWANRRREDCVGSKNIGKGTKMNPIVKELEDLTERYPENLRVEYVVDEEGTFLDRKRLMRSALATKKKINGADVKYGATTSRIDERLLLVSGPEGFVTYLAGPRRWEGGVETQGELGGVLGKLGVRGWRVWKL